MKRVAAEWRYGETQPAVVLFGLTAMATGLIDLLWGAFEPAEEPIQAFGDHVPGQHVFADIVAICLIVAGGATLRRRSAWLGAIGLAAIYLLFAVFHAPRLYTAPHFLGFRFPVVVGVLAGMCQQLILVAAALLIAVSYRAVATTAQARFGAVARWVFGISSIDFGLAHLSGIAASVDFVPAWMPFGQAFWVIFTGVAFILAGIAILSRVLDVLAARLLAVMLLVFSAMTLTPRIFASPHDQSAWGVDVYNLAAVTAAWVLSDWLAQRERRAAVVREMQAAT